MGIDVNVAPARAWLGLVLLTCVLLDLGGPARALAQDAPKASPVAAPAGRPSLRAVRRQGEIEIDGVLDEADWQRAPVTTPFLERTPVPGRKPVVTTQARILYDRDAVYVGVRLENEPGTRPRALQMERDSFSIWADDALTLKFDVRLDRRTTVGFTVNPAGAQMDYIALENGAIFRREYDALWECETTVTDEAWYAELRLPVAALGIPDGEGERIMGLNIARDYNARARVYYWAPIPPELSTTTATRYGDLRGIEDIGGGRPLILNPYALVRFAKDPNGTPSEQDGDWTGKAGGNISMRLSEDIWGELSILPDFAEVDTDDVVINLGRFPIQLPERRPFFLSGLDVFEFGRAAESQLFFSRRIGLGEDIYGGAKVYGRDGNLAFGLLNVATEPGRVVVPEDPDEAPDLAAQASNWSVGRARYSFGGNGHVGGLLAMRHALSDPNDGGSATRSHYSAGTDVTLRTSDARWTWASFGAATFTRDDGPVEDPDLRRRGDSAGTRIDYKHPRFQPSLAALYVSKDFNPEVGFVLRRNVANYEAALPWLERNTLGAAEIRTEASSQVSQSPEDGSLVGYRQRLEHRWQWANPWSVTLRGTVRNDVVPSAFDVDRYEVAAGDYTFGTGTVVVSSPFVRNPRLTLTYERGSYYGGGRHRVVGETIVSITRHVRLLTAATVNRFDFPGLGPFTTTAMNTRAVLAATPKLLLSLVAQYNSTRDSWGGQARLRWRYWPGSDVIAVYNERLFSGNGRGLGSARSDFRSVTVKLSHRFDAML